MPKIKLESEYDDLDKYINNDDDIFYYKKDTDILHNPYGPANITEDGTKYYFIEDKVHRLDGPAIIVPNSKVAYYINDEFLSKEEFEVHPERLKYLGNSFNMPKVQSEYAELDKYQNKFEIRYFKKDTKIYHNPYGPAYIDKDGYKSYFIEGVWHRLDGAARIWPNGEEEYYINGVWHRLDGPAVIYSDGEGGYYINGEKLSKEEFELHPERLKFIGKEYLTCLK